MRRSWVLVAVSLVALGTSACGGPPPERAATITAPPSESAAPAPTAAAPATTEPPKTADLKKLLLTLDDMPSGWSQEKETGSKPPTVSPSACQALYIDGVGVVATAATKFTRGEIIQIRERIYNFKDAKKQMDRERSLMQSCTSMKVSDKSTTSTIKTAPLSFKNYGDEALAVRQTATSSGFTFIGDSIYTRVGDYVVFLQSFDSEPLDALEPVLKSAIAKVKAGS
jgi:hypothetical protein